MSLPYIFIYYNILQIKNPKNYRKILVWKINAFFFIFWHLIVSNFILVFIYIFFNWVASYDKESTFSIRLIMSSWNCGMMSWFLRTLLMNSYSSSIHLDKLCIQTNYADYNPRNKLYYIHKMYPIHIQSKIL